MLWNWPHCSVKLFGDVLCSLSIGVSKHEDLTMSCYLSEVLYCLGTGDMWHFKVLRSYIYES